MEIGVIRKHVGGWGTIGGKSAENGWKIGENFAQNRRSVLPGWSINHFWLVNLYSVNNLS